MADMMTFPETVEEFMEQYKVVDTKRVYTNGVELVPIFRMKQWFEHLPSAEPEIITCKYCKNFRRWIDTDITFCDLIDGTVCKDDFCSKAERITDEAD